MKTLAMLFLAAAINVVGAGAFAQPRIRFAQSSTATACMMGCNATAANCQTTCLVPGTSLTVPPNTPNAVTPITNPTASTSCLLNCGNAQIACQVNCARQSPSP
jgi:hypothetical protein